MIRRSGLPGLEIVTGADWGELQPNELVTVKVNTPPGRLEIVLLTPVPVVRTAPGVLVIVHVPDEGKPFSATLPDGTANVGWVIVPITGAVGTGGCAGTTTLAEADDKQPSSVVTVKLYVPNDRPLIVVLVPVPVVLTVPG